MTPIRVPRPAQAVIALLLLLLVPGAATAQLISPGKLSSEHAELEGMTHCTECHELRTRGIAPDRCLSCHEPLAARIAAGSGLHAGADHEACASCHREHLGRDYALIRWEPEAFDHASVGFELEDSHAELGCRDCHSSTRVRDVQVRRSKVPYAALNRTYLGLGTACVDCHEMDDPHEGGFAPRPCSDCHDQVDWEAAASFDHDETRYPLTGRHRSVGCNDCHRTDSFTGLRFAACTDCHTDPHEGGMQAVCTSCHATTGWQNVSREAVESGFDHDRVFPLEAAHAAADCSSCHEPGPELAATIRIAFRPETVGRGWPAPRIGAGCASCHVDLHRGELDRAGAAARCSDCHTQAAWYPSTFDVARHDEETEFLLEGAHAATPCAACHDAPLGEGQFTTARPETCADCHGTDQPHGNQFEGRACDSCHGTDSFRIPEFDHSATAFTLEGAHEAVACSSCHRDEPRPGGGTFVRYRPLAADGCSDCHGDDS